MNSQNDKEGLGHNKAVIIAAIIGGVFALLAACVTGVFLVFNTLVDKGNIVVVPTPQSQVQPSTLVTPTSLSSVAISPTQPTQCSHFQVASSTQTMVTVPAGMWEVTRKCSPSQSACFYTMEQSSGGQYLSYEHNGNSDRYWVNAFCTEPEAKSFANIDAKAMLEWWQNTQQNPFP